MKTAFKTSRSRRTPRRWSDPIDRDFDKDREIRFGPDGLVLQDDNMIEPHTMWMREETYKRPITLPDLLCLREPICKTLYR